MYIYTDAIMITWEYKYEFIDDVYLQIISYPIVLHGNSIISIALIRKCKNLYKVRIIYFIFNIKTTIQFFTSNTDILQILNKVY